MELELSLAWWDVYFFVVTHTYVWYLCPTRSLLGLENTSVVTPATAKIRISLAALWLYDLRFN